MALFLLTIATLILFILVNFISLVAAYRGYQPPQWYFTYPYNSTAMTHGTTTFSANDFVIVPWKGASTKPILALGFGCKAENLTEGQCHKQIQRKIIG